MLLAAVGDAGAGTDRTMCGQGHLGVGGLVMWIAVTGCRQAIGCHRQLVARKDRDWPCAARVAALRLEPNRRLLQPEHPSPAACSEQLGSCTGWGLFLQSTRASCCSRCLKALAVMLARAPRKVGSPPRKVELLLQS